MVDAFMNVKYYGAGATPEESTAVFGMESYSEQENDYGNTFNKNIYVDGVFGGVK